MRLRGYFLDDCIGKTKRKKVGNDNNVIDVKAKMSITVNRTISAKNNI
jgi:hypothetical protein